MQARRAKDKWLLSLLQERRFLIFAKNGTRTNDCRIGGFSRPRCGFYLANTSVGWLARKRISATSRPDQRNPGTGLRSPAKPWNGPRIPDDFKVGDVATIRDPAPNSQVKLRFVSTVFVFKRQDFDLRPNLLKADDRIAAFEIVNDSGRADLVYPGDRARHPSG